MTEGSVERIISGKQKELGGLTVRRLLPVAKRRSVGAFVFLDHMGPTILAAGQGLDVPPHPHIGLATVTYLYEGSILHRDSLGSLQEILPGDVNWMTAGRGIVHSERSGELARSSHQELNGLQLWVALPKDREETAPAFVHTPKQALPVIAGEGWTGRLIAGELFGQQSPVSTFTRLFFADISLNAASSLRLQPNYDEAAVYVVLGEVEIDSQLVAAGELAVLNNKPKIELLARKSSVIAVLGGDALHEPRIMYWNFVSTSQSRIEQAKKEWRDQQYDRVPGETDFVPLPE
ncbi:pirin family protein [Sneathiella marina]|uniref:Pirin family protein n=1 Tax=Sneathiella marina TaxID=2950108 RepID=A0ABY4W420_9PROT|nr:pirin family protein [Sneathiella marina]USG60863.1 pirin family protein [Sneathiella marina]